MWPTAVCDRAEVARRRCYSPPPPPPPQPPPPPPQLPPSPPLQPPPMLIPALPRAHQWASFLRRRRFRRPRR
ncbi:hypothetical protein CEQ30_40630 [Nocardia brasiliensis]|nr:hypothetical protein CEQ30_40630 [Nocardia brasiliensis]